MGMEKMLLRFLRAGLLLVFILTLGACGGGGGGSEVSSGGVGTQGQVIKGLVAGSQVSVYSLGVSGQRSFIASVVTNNVGAFSLPSGLTFTKGGVYLLEAVGGSFVNEITGASEPLNSPLRAIFVADQPVATIAISPISEMVAIEVERSANIDRWSPAEVARAESKVRSLFDISSSSGIRYSDLARTAVERIEELSEDEFAFSFQLGIFAGYLEETKRRNNAGLSTAVRSFYELIDGASGQPQNSLHAAGLIRYMESLPFASFSFKAEVYRAYGLPSDASLSAFEGAETSGSSAEPVPNFRLRNLSRPFFSSGQTSDTIFDARGALVAYRQGSSDSGLGFAHVGFASVADVYGTNETAIGRWNRGYFYPLGVGLDSQRTQFVFPDQVRPEALERDMVYAAGAPADNVPICGGATLTLRAQTSKLVAFDRSFELRLAPSSKLAYRFTRSGVYVGYDLQLLDEQGRSHRMSSPGDGDPLQGAFLRGTEREARSWSGLTLPSGETINLSILVAGNQARKGVIIIESNISDPRGRGIAAAFEQVETDLACAPIQLPSGSVSPIPQTGDYLFGLSFVQGLEFFDNGTPKFRGITGLSANNGLSKFGNDLAGIGLVASSFEAGTNRPLDLSTYGYRKWSINPPPMPRSGSATYRLVSSTPFVVSGMPLAFSGEWELIDVGVQVASATLTIYFNGEPVGPPSEFYGVCQLTINDGPVLSGGYYKDNGGCLMQSGIQFFGEEYSGGITADENRYAVITYTKYLSSVVKREVALLFEKIPK